MENSKWAHGWRGWIATHCRYTSLALFTLIQLIFVFFKYIVQVWFLVLSAFLSFCFILVSVSVFSMMTLIHKENGAGWPLNKFYL